MNKPKDETFSPVTDANAMRQTIAQLQEALDVQRRVSYAAGLFQGEVTVRTMIGSLAEGLIVVDHDQRIVLINDQAAEMFGYDKDECVGHFLDILLPERFRQVHQHHAATYSRFPILTG